MRHLMILATLLAAATASRASAGELYRCLSKAGETVFTGSSVGYRDCKRIGAVAPGWHYLESAAGFSVYIHERVDKTAEHGGWVLWDYDAPRRFGGAKFLSMVTHYHLDCAAHTGRVVSAGWFTGHMMEGESLGSIEQAQAVDPVPGSVDDVIVTNLCERPANR